MISKELLSEVLDCKDLTINEINSKAVVVRYMTKEGIEDGKWVNIHELAHKCKEWAFKNSYTLIIENYFSRGCDCTLSTVPNGNLGYQFDADTEPKAIFKVCQWILDNKDSQ